MFLTTLMDTALGKALEDLERAGANGLPASSDVESANDGAKWSGKKSNGDTWSLIKHKVGSYNCAF